MARDGEQLEPRQLSVAIGTRSLRPLPSPLAFALLFPLALFMEERDDAGLCWRVLLWRPTATISRLWQRVLVPSASQDLEGRILRPRVAAPQVQRAGGERTDDEKRALNARIEKLTSQLEGVNAEHSMLTEQATTPSRLLLP